LNIETHPRSGLCRIRGGPKELNKLENSFSLLAGQAGDATGHGGMRVWIRRAPNELEVLTGFLLTLELENAGALGLPACALSPVAGRLTALQKGAAPFLRPYQEQAVWAAVTAPWGRGIVVAPTGSGKTRICHAIPQVAEGLWLYLAPSRALADQTAAGAPANMICTSFGCAREDVLLACDGLLIDEAHRIAAETYSRVVLRSAAKFRIGLSATALMRSDPKNSLTIGLLGPQVFRITLEQLQADGFLPGGVVKTVHV
jgi:hypothetical protein